VQKYLKRKLSIFVVIIFILATFIGSFQQGIKKAFAADQGITVHFYKPSGWSKANIYYYGDNFTGPAWPGSAMTQEGGNWYSYTIFNHDSVRVLFNDGNGNQIPGPGQPGFLVSGESWYKDGQWTNSNPDAGKGDINIYVEKPADWNEIWIWYDGDLSTPAWDTTVLRTAPGDMTNYRPNWYMKTIKNTNKVQFLFNDGTWNRKIQKNGVDYVTTKDVWVKKDGSVYYTDPVGEITPVSIKLSGNDTVKVGENISLTSTIVYSDGSEAQQAVNWTVSNSSLATLSASSGKTTTLTAIKEGTVTVEAVYGNISAKKTITITKLPDTYIKVYFQSPWNTAKIYYWGTTPSIPAVQWPGVNMKAEGDNWYSYTFEGATFTNLIFNNGSGAQTADLNRTAGTWYYYNNTWNNIDPRQGGGEVGDTEGPTTIASPSSGRYLTTQKVTLVAIDNEDPSPKIYFTTDGSKPQLTDAYLYRGQSITVDRDMEIYTIAVDAAGNKTENHFMYNIGEYNANDFREETIYFLMTTRFYDGDPSNNVHCWDDVQAGNPDSDPAWRGDFKGLIDKLDYIKALGFSAIWITPPVKNASGYDYHGYHAIDFTEIDPRYKTKYDNSAEESYQKLINAAHAKGMKIIQDVVYNHTGNFGEENLFPMFERLAPTTMNDLAKTSLRRIDNGKLPANYFDLNPAQQYQVRLSLMKEAVNDVNHIYHHEKSMEWEGYTCQTGQIAGDCVDLNTENPTVANYLNNAYSKYIAMGVDAFRVDTVKHVSRLTFNKEFIPSIKAAGGEDFYVFGEVCTRVRDVWNRGIPALSAPFYTWKESKNYPWGDRVTNENSVYQNYYDNLNVSTQPTSNNAFLDGNNYRPVDTSMKSGLDVIDFPMHWNFANARDAFRVAVEGDKYYNDATWNVVYVDSHDYAPDTAPENQRFALGQDVWAENLSLMFTFRGIPCIYYGSEIEFQKGKPIDVGPNAPLSQTGRAYFGDYIEGNVVTTDFGVYTNATGTMAETLNHPLAQHINRLNRIRRAIPALQKGQYSVQDISGDGMAYKRRFTDAAAGVDSFALITVSGSATFRNIPNGRYVDAVTGQVINVTNGTLTANCSGKGNLRVFVLDQPGNPAPGKIGGYSKYLY